MEGDTLWAVLIIAGLCYWVWSANRTKPPPTAGSQTQEPVAFTSTEGKQEPDAFLAQVQSERIAAQRQASDEAHAYKQEVERRVVDDEKLKARLTKFAKDNDLPRALSTLFEEIKNYPVWSLRDDFQQYDKLHATDLSRDQPEPFKDQTIHFTLDGTRYSLRERRWSGMEMESYVDLTLSENGEEVFGASYRYEYDYVASYGFCDLRAFKRKGKWASMLVRSAAMLDGVSSFSVQ